MDFELYTNDLLADIRDWVDYNIDYTKYDSIEDLRDYLNDELWSVDSVTGNGSIGYYANNKDAKERFVEDGIDGFYTIREEWGIPKSEVLQHLLNSDWNWFDATIRCFLLGQCIDVVLEDIREEFDLAHENMPDDAEVPTDNEDYDEGFEESLRKSRRRRAI